jgi:hypothetical protein
MTEITGGRLFARALQAEGIEFPCPGIINTPIIPDGILRGQLGADQEKIIAFYDKHGVASSFHHRRKSRPPVCCTDFPHGWHNRWPAP